MCVCTVPLCILAVALAPLVLVAGTIALVCSAAVRAILHLVPLAAGIVMLLGDRWIPDAAWEWLV